MAVVSHATDLVEHPELVADRLMAFAEIVGEKTLSPAPTAAWVGASIRKSPGQAARPVRRHDDREQEVVELIQLPVHDEQNKKQKL